MKLRRIMDKRRICLICSMLSLPFLLAACGGGSGESGNNSETGSISFNLVWQSSTDQRQAGFVRKWPNPDVCVDYAIGAIDVSVLNSSGNEIASANWRCDAHSGTVSSVPAGSGITLTLVGMVGGNADWQGQVPGITVNKGQNTNVGSVDMNYIGSDATPPTASNPYPADGALGVPINTSITVDFSEDIVAASVYAASCALHLSGDTTPVAGTVIYIAFPPRAVINPATDLAPNANYTVTITTEIADLAGNTMAADYTWSFTTSATAAQTLIWGETNWGEGVWN